MDIEITVDPELYSMMVFVTLGVTLFESMFKAERVS